MRNVLWGLILITIGLLFLLDNMDVIDFGEAIRTYWPLLFVLWGVSILLKRKDHGATHVFRDATQNVSGELFHESSVFGDLVVNIHSQDFKGGSLSNVFGGNHIDLSKASIADGEHWLKVSNVFGNVNITVPPDLACSVVANVLLGEAQVFEQRKSGFFADVQYTSPGYDTSQKKLKISISQVVGNVSVSSS